MKQFVAYLFMSACFLLSSCKKDKESAAAKVITDVTFGDDAKQKMDVYLPEGRSEQTPVVIMLHGGGFVAGDKSEFSARAQQFSAKGFAVLNVNYRLVSVDGVFSNPLVHQPRPV